MMAHCNSHPKNNERKISMRQRFKNKVVAVTGATSGIGLRAVELFIEEGARVVAIDREVNAGLELQNRFPNARSFCKVRCSKFGRTENSY